MGYISKINGHSVKDAEARTLIANVESKIPTDYATSAALEEVKKDVEDIVIPTKVSDLTNDSSYATETYVEEAVGAVVVPTKTSDLENDSAFATEDFVEEAVGAISVGSGDIDAFFITSDNLLTLTAKESGEVLTKIEIRKVNGEIIRCYANMKVQGSSSSSYEKKNYTIKFYSDERCSKKLKINVGWGNEYKYCFKANYIDTMHCRNITGAKIAYDMVESRPDSEFKAYLQTAPRNGAIDGFPVKVYLNGEFHGLYTWNIPKDGWQFGMDDDNPNHVVLAGEFNNNQDLTTENPVQFRSLWDPSDETVTAWGVEMGEATDEVVASLNRVINFVMTASDTEFHDNINEYMDLYSLMDYYLFSDFCVHLDGLGNNMLFATYDGVQWGACLYDMDTIFGAWWDGSSYVATDYACPDDYQENNSLLWQRLVTCFPRELKERYFELRDGALSLGNIISHAEGIYNAIPDRVFADEQTKWTSLPSVDTNTMTRLRDYMRDRAVVIDAKYEAITYTAACTGVKMNTTSLTFTNDDIQEVDFALTPVYTSDTVTWTTTPAGLCDVINGNQVVPLKNGSGTLKMTCGSYSASCPISISGVNDKLSYIESDGTQYIETNYEPKYYASYELSCNFNFGSMTWGHLLASDNFFKLQWQGSGNNLAINRQNLTYIIDTTTLEGTDVVLRVTNVPGEKVYINGAEVTATLVPTDAVQGLVTENNLTIFSGWLESVEESTARGEFKFYSLKVEEFGEVIHYFVPVLKDGVACVYDLIEKEYFYNANTSGNAFTYSA